MASQPEQVVLGLWFEDFRIGEERLSPGRTITEGDVMTFAGLTGDYSQVHTDEEFCRKTEFGTRMLRAEERISALAADAETGKLLEVPVGTPLLCVDRVSYTYGDKPVEVRRGLYRTDRHYYKNVLS